MRVNGKRRNRNNVSIGLNATILPVNISDNVVIGAGAVVTKSIQNQCALATTDYC